MPVFTLPGNCLHRKFFLYLKSIVILGLFLAPYPSGCHACRGCSSQAGWQTPAHPQGLTLTCLSSLPPSSSCLLRKVSVVKHQWGYDDGEESNWPEP